MNMKTFKRSFKWGFTNGAFAILLWLGFVENIEGARHLGIFMAWVSLLMAAAAISEPGLKILRENGRVIPVQIDTAFDIAVFCFLVWHGAIWTGIAYSIHYIVMAAAWGKALDPEEAAQ